MMDPIVHVSEDPGAIAGALVVEALQTADARSGRARLAVPGGGSPVPVFRWLRTGLPEDLRSRLVLTWADERHVPHPGDDWRAWPDDSNRRLAWAEWLSHLDGPVQTVPMSHPGSLEAARAAFETAFDTHLGGLDVALLGAGGDGHIASLFPGHPGLGATGACLAVQDSPKPPPERLSLTLSVLNDVDRIVFIGLGAGKGQMLRRLREGADLPLGRLAPRGDLHWVLDPDAAHAAGLASPEHT